MSGMALYLSLVPCVAIYGFIALFMQGVHKMEQEKLAREATEDMMANIYMTDSAQAYLASYPEFESRDA
jgi:hypothetical protein